MRDYSRRDFLKRAGAAGLVSVVLPALASGAKENRGSINVRASSMKQKIILDTDIGDDIDDAFTLGMILGCPEFELVGVTTVFRNVSARARLAQTILKAAGREDVPVAAGCGASMTLEPNLPSNINPMKSYLEGEELLQGAASEPESELPAIDSRHGVDFIIEKVMAGDGDITIVTIGAMTNMAMAIIKEPKIIAKIPKIVSMAATFDQHMAEWNILCDPVAADIVFRSGISLDIIGLDVTLKVLLKDDKVEEIRRSGRPVAKKLAEAHALWKGKSKAISVMHDPLAAATMIKPELVKWKTGTASVELAGKNTFGFTTFVEDDKGLHRYAFEVDNEAMVKFWLERVLSV